jgi:hypothetical protein
MQRIRNYDRIKRKKVETTWEERKCEAKSVARRKPATTQAFDKESA